MPARRAGAQASVSPRGTVIQ
ncbi:hypothetical protein E2C01_068720 [Portunus trituberculatus]|uniref:Uncharacterized protein n=1 Tax=Portunus trituberculatus TaxID=210409 RepID=A0A5B7HWN6_PORTR|nr:hypothetical protein [Portunus trituberculatus]